MLQIAMCFMKIGITFAKIEPLVTFQAVEDCGRIVEDCDAFCKDCGKIAEDWPKIGQYCLILLNKKYPRYPNVFIIDSSMKLDNFQMYFPN